MTTSGSETELRLRDGSRHARCELSSSAKRRSKSDLRSDTGKPWGLRVPSSSLIRTVLPET